MTLAVMLSTVSHTCLAQSAAPGVTLLDRIVIDASGDASCPPIAALDYVVSHPTLAALASADEFGLMSPVVAQAIPHSNLAALPASSIRPELEAFFSILAKGDPRIIGGKLPDEGFYAL